MCRVRTHAYARMYARPYCVFASAYAHAYAYNSYAYARAYCEYELAYAQFCHAYVRTYAPDYILFFSNEGKKYNVCSLASILLYNIINVDKRVSVSFASLCNFVQQVPASSKLQCQVQNRISYPNFVCILVFIFDFPTPVSCYQRMTVARRTNGQ